MQQLPAFKTIGIAKELEAEENPGGLDQRVILNPSAVRALVDRGCDVSVQRDAGVGIGITDDEYLSAGAVIQDHDALYTNKDLVIKYKGPSQRNIGAMTAGSTLLSMAHLDVFSARRDALKHRGVNVVTMEKVRGWRDPVCTTYVRSQLLARKATRTLDPNIADRTVVFAGFGERTLGAFQTLARARPARLFIIPELNAQHLAPLGKLENLFIVFDSADAKPGICHKKLDLLGIDFLDLDFADETETASLLLANPDLLVPSDLGQRKIHCLFETGYCGTRYGIDLLRRPGGNLAGSKNGVAVLLGYGNVSVGAIQALLEAKIEIIRVMTRRDLVQSRMKTWFKQSDIIVCAAEQDADLRGHNFYVSNRNLAEDIPDGSVVIDLIGGTPNKRCPVEALVQTTFLPQIHFEQDGVYVAGLWGWDLAGRVLESAKTYSEQTTDVLIGEDMLINGLSTLAPGLRDALVLGPYVH